MYGLLSKAYDNYRIQKESSVEGYHGRNRSDCVMVSLLEAMLTVVVLLCVFDLYLVQKLDVIYLALILFSFYIPVLGEFIALAVLVYWFLNIRERSILISKF